MHTNQNSSSFKRPSLRNATSDPDGRTNSQSRFAKFVAFATRKFSQDGKKDRPVFAPNKPDSKDGTIQRDTAMLPSVTSIRDELRLSTEATAYHNGGVPTFSRRYPYGSESVRSSCEERAMTSQEVLPPGSNFRVSCSEPDFNMDSLKKMAKRSSASLRRRFGFVSSAQDPLSDILRTTSPLPFPTSTSLSAVSAIGHALMDGTNWSSGSKSTCLPAKQRVSRQAIGSPTPISESSTVDTIIAIINLYANTGDRMVVSPTKKRFSLRRQSMTQSEGPFRSSFKPSTTMPVLKPEVASHETPDFASMYPSKNRPLLDAAGPTVGALDRLASLIAWNHNHGTSHNAISSTGTAISLRIPALNLVPATPNIQEARHKEEDSYCEDGSSIYDCYDQTNDDMIATAL